MSERAARVFWSFGRGIRWWAPFITVGLVAHGLLLVDGGLYLDDWWALARILEGQFWDFIGMNTSLGSIPSGWILGVLLQLPGPIFVQRLSTLALLVVSAGLVTKLARASRLATPRQAQALGMLTLVAPAHRALPVFSQATPLLMLLASFLTAGLLVLRAEPLAGPPRRWRRGLALFLFWVSFYLNSLLVPYVAGATALAVRAWLRDRRTWLVWIRAHWPFLFLPWVFWGDKLLRIYGLGWEAHNYNRVAWDPTGMLLVYQEAFQTYAQMARAWLRPDALLLLGAAALTLTLARRAFFPEPAPRGAGFRLALLGLALFVLGLFPYAAVGKGIGPPGAHWSSHYGILLGPPLAFLAVGLLGAVFGGLPRLASVLVLTLAGLWATDAVRAHVHWQADAIKWQAVCQQVGRSREVRDTTIVAVVDQVPFGMHTSVEGGDMPPTVVHGRWTTRATFGSGFTPFFDHFCARGARKLAAWVPVPDRGGYLDSARDVLDVLRRAGTPPSELDPVGRALDGDVTVEAMRAVVGAHPATFLEGLRRLELENGYRALRSRVHLRLLGLPAGPAVEVGLRKDSGDIFYAHAIADPSPSVLVLVKPGSGYRAVPVGHRGWWRQARRLWGGYQGARLRGPAAVHAFLDRLVAVEVLQLTR